MGLAITEILTPETISIEDLKNKTLAVDTYNLLYQFLSSIRQADGSLLMDSKGRVTSHLSGLFHRITRLMGYGMKFIFCFDGEVPELKNRERERRKEIKIEAQKKYEAAAKKEDLEGMKKFAFFSSRRRHTRCSRDWSSDVCSSDLADAGGVAAGAVGVPLARVRLGLV